jgi:hypothetical protein
MIGSAKGKVALGCATGVLALVCSLPAAAQFGSGGGMGGGRRGTRGPDATDSRDAATPRTVPASDALYEVRTRLLIAQDQAAAWERFYQAYMAWLAVGAGARPPADTGGALQSVEQQLSLAQNRFALTEELADAMKTLLAALTEAQQQTADDLLPRLLRLTSASGQRIGAR